MAMSSKESTDLCKQSNYFMDCFLLKVTGIGVPF